MYDKLLFCGDEALLDMFLQFGYITKATRKISHRAQVKNLRIPLANYMSLLKVIKRALF